MFHCRLHTIPKSYAEELVDEYLVPKLDGRYDVVVGVLNAGKPIADIVARKLGLKCEYVKCTRIYNHKSNGIHPEQGVRVEGKREYGKSPLFVDDICSAGTTLASLKKVYPNSRFASLVAKLEIFQPASTVEPLVRYITPGEAIIGAVSENSVVFEWEGEKFLLPKKEIDVEVWPEQNSSFEFYSTDKYKLLFRNGGE